MRYRVLAALFHVGLRAVLGRRLHVEGLENVPRSGGPLLFAANHLSNLDPMLLGGFTPGANCAMAKRELYARPFLAWLYGGANCFPVERGIPDRWALRTALAMLQHGGRLMIWVEGTRAERPGMRRCEPGVGFLLRRQPVPVVPVAITGSQAVLVHGRLPRRTDVTMRFGAPTRLDISGREGNQAVADRVGALVAALLPPEYQGYYAAPISSVHGR